MVQFTKLQPINNETKWYFPIAFSNSNSYSIALGYWYYNNYVVGMNSGLRNTTHIIFNSAIGIAVYVSVIAIGY